MLKQTQTAKPRFQLFLIKPSHYDDDGYVIQWFRSAIPSNSLAALCGIVQDSADRNVLGEDVAVEIHAYDETNTHIRPGRLARLIRSARLSAGASSMTRKLRPSVSSTP